MTASPAARASRFRRPRGSRVDRAAWRAIKPLLPESGDVDDFVAAIAAHRRRRIWVLSCDLPESAPSGVWVQTAETDYIVHAASITGEYRTAVVCHEVAHMVLDHDAAEQSVDTTGIAPSIAPEVAARFFTRHGYENEAETAAEALGTLLAAELTARASARTGSTQQMRDTVSARLR